MVREAQTIQHSIYYNLSQISYLLIVFICKVMLSHILDRDTKDADSNTACQKVTNNHMKIYPNYSRTSMARTLMARLPRLFRTRS